MTRHWIAALILPAVILATDLNNPTGSHGLVLIDKRGAHVRFVDPSTYKELSNLEIGNAPHDLAISPDHKTVYIPIYGDGVYGKNPHPGHTIAVIDLGTRQVTATIDVSPYIAPHGIQVDSRGKLYVSCDLSRKLLVIDPKTRAIESAIDTEGTGHWVAVLPDGSKAYVPNKNDKLFISVIDLKARKMTGRIPAPNGIQGIAESPDGKRVVASDLAEPTLLVIDTATDSVIDRVAIQGMTRGSFKPRYTPDGSKILICSISQGQGQVNIINASDLHGKQQVLEVGKNPMGFAFAPDGRTALVANDGDGTVTVIDLDQKKVVSSFQAGTGIETAAYY
ncbi:MAG TPA: YncE family protein [Bryobacteraceae bacterium]|jgi:DNA-binding beta-propeller fold protein YncE|nr:YncE family protein [Bryobacteraceae bacterium]